MPLRTRSVARRPTVRKQVRLAAERDPRPEPIRGAHLSGPDPDPSVLAVAERRRSRSRENGPSSRQTGTEASARASFAGAAEAAGARIERFVRADAAGGFVLAPCPTPGGLGEFVDRVVPLFQERSALRTEYTGTAPRSHLGSPDPVWKG
ncbi:hypothetical protein O1Q96_13000 [Streptomyces sp. Qhu-G9]|uniref:hypothetical protein n=1 Tax=Streptomyces sp. Qhu-G9 TaxID=3452799 RepID=UPI0022AC7A3F|nr:hypothetical protein [Streptomyces aurantiacus]WAU80600.1 hypothetical protein O1Q96_13000 [Streptomyces aurantiacus]